jgi:aryl-alcohol dehydrogenase-like predicted oxidoreductase
MGLGTVQFGMNYGVSNDRGRPDEAEIAAILADAQQAGIGYLDTAAGYGDAEVLIGRHLPPGNEFRIVTKILPVPADEITSGHERVLLDSIEVSLSRLKVDRVYGLLVHDAADFAKGGWQHLVAALHEARARGWVQRIGVSIYRAEEIELFADRFVPEILQLPINALDRRLIATGQLERLKARGVEVHARSVFLQGLLLMDPSTYPNFFDPVRAPVAALRARWKAEGISPLAGCLAFVLQEADIDTVLVGVNRRAELKEIEIALESLSGKVVDLGSVAPIDPIYLDPSRWPRSGV